MTNNTLPNAVAQAIVRHAQHVFPYMAGVIFIKNIFQKWNIVFITRFANPRYKIIITIQLSTCMHIHKINVKRSGTRAIA